MIPMILTPLVIIVCLPCVLMKKEGFDVYIARSGEEALAMIKSEQPDLILLDIMMPDVDGYEVCRFVKSSDLYSMIKVVFLSAKTSKEDIKKGYAAGADSYVVKPFSTRDLVRAIKQLIGKS